MHYKYCLSTYFLKYLSVFLHVQPETGSAVPKFGDWDEKDPSTGEGFTDIFEKVREEKQSGADNVGTSHAYTDRYNRGGRYESSVSSL